MMKSLSVVILIAVLVISCSKKPESAQAPPIVSGSKIETVRASSVDDYYEAVGTVRAKNSSVVAAKIMGNIVAFRVREGDVVRPGQVLVEIENRDASIQLQKTRAGVRETQDSLEEVEKNIRAAESAHTAALANERLAKTTLGRYQTLFDRRSVSPQEFDEVRARYEVAKAESERADRMLQVAKAKRSQVQARIDQANADVANAQVYAGYSRIAAPIAGVVVSKQADVGSMAMPGTPLLTIEDSSNYQLEASVQESQLGKIQLHDRVRVLIDALGDRELEGTVAEIVPAADPASRSYVVKVALPNVPGAQLRSGLYGKAGFLNGQRKVLAIPQVAIVQQGQLTSAFVVDQTGVARLRLVKTGKTFGDRIEVLSGLSEGEQILSERVAEIKDGTRVRDASGDLQRVSVKNP
jgi:multidrug efflux system membrane fusion protein